MTQACILKVFTSNLGQDTGYADLRFSHRFRQALQKIFEVLPRLGHLSLLLRYYGKSWKVARSRLDEVNIFFFNLPNPSGRPRPWGLLSL
jgi:hypothetical protein